MNATIFERAGARTREGEATSRRPRLRRMKLSLNVAILALAGVMIGAPAAYAATYYANGTPTSMNQVRTSQNFASVSGGSASVVVGDLGAPVQVRIETFRPAPGYQTLGSGTGTGTVSITHATATNAQQKCWWRYTAGNVAGPLDLTCRAF